MQLTWFNAHLEILFLFSFSWFFFFFLKNVLNFSLFCQLKIRNF